MVAPINYMQQQQPDLGADFAQGIQIGNAIRQQRKLRAEEEQAANFKTEFQSALTGNDPRAFIALQAKYPKYGQGIKQTWEALSEEQRSAELLPVMQTFTAIQSGRPDVAFGIIDEHIGAMKNSGRDASKLLGIRSMMERDPKSAGQYVGAVLSAIAPKEFAENLTKLGAERRADEKQPGEIAQQKATLAETQGRVALQTPAMRKAEADAEAAAVTARFAESNAVKDLETKGWNIKKLQTDIDVAKENARIAAMNAKINAEGNAIKREELKIKRDEAVEKRDEKVRAKTAEAESAAATFDNTIGVINDLLSDEDSLRAAIGTGAWRGAIPGTKARAVAGKIEQLQNAVAATNLDKIKGAMSDKDIMFLKNIESNLDRYQDEEAFLKELTRVGGALVEAEKRMGAKNGRPVQVRPPFKGTVQDGYRFNGGDPANPASWSKV